MSISDLFNRTISYIYRNFTNEGKLSTVGTKIDTLKEEIKLIDLCEEHDILSGSFQLSSGYTSIGDKRYVFNWNRDKIPAPEKLTQYFHEKGLRLCANI